MVLGPDRNLRDPLNVHEMNVHSIKVTEVHLELRSDLPVTGSFKKAFPSPALEGEEQQRVKRSHVRGLKPLTQHQCPEWPVNPHIQVCEVQTTATIILRKRKSRIKKITSNSVV